MFFVGAPEYEYETVAKLFNAEDVSVEEMPETAAETLKRLGWINFDYECFNADGNVEFEHDEAEWEVNPETGKSRHCGYGEGCFWTDWE